MTTVHTAPALSPLAQCLSSSYCAEYVPDRPDTVTIADPFQLLSSVQFSCWLFGPTVDCVSTLLMHLCKDTDTCGRNASN